MTANIEQIMAECDCLRRDECRAAGDCVLVPTARMTAQQQPATDAWDGRPQNPERDGDHIIKTTLGVRIVLTWSAEHQGFAGVNGEHYLADTGCTYLGPCATPAEVAALRERCQRAEAFIAARGTALDAERAARQRADAERDAARAAAVEAAAALVEEYEIGPDDRVYAYPEIVRRDARIAAAIRALAEPRHG